MKIYSLVSHLMFAFLFWIGSGASCLILAQSTYQPTSGTTQWLTDNNWNPVGAPDAQDSTAILQATSGANTVIASDITLGHLEVNLHDGSWGIMGPGAIIWDTSGIDLPSITVTDLVGAKQIAISAPIKDANPLTPKALSIQTNVSVGGTGGQIVFSGDNTSFTGGFRLGGSNHQRVTFLTEESLGANEVRVTSTGSVVQHVRLGSGTDARTFNNDFIVEGGSLALYTNASSGGGTITLGGTISGVGNVQFWSSNGSNSLELKGINTYTGNTYILGGPAAHPTMNLIFHGVENFGNGSSILFDNITNGIPTLIWATGNTDDLTKKADHSARIVNFVNNRPVLNVGTNDVEFANALTSNNNINAGFAKAGSGILRLLGASTYYGTTAITEGTLLINNTIGSGTGNSSVTVEAGAVLGGNGILKPASSNAILIKDGAFFSVGDVESNGGIGHLTFDLSSTSGKVIFENGSILNVDLADGLVADLVTIVGSDSEMVVFSDAEIHLFDQSTVELSAGDYTLFSAANSNIYDGLTFAGDQIIDGLTVSQNIVGYNSSLWMEEGNIVLKMEAIPEPRTLALLGLTFACLFVVSCRKRFNRVLVRQKKLRY